MAGMTVAELVARLRADTSDFGRGIRRAESDLMRFQGRTSRMADTIRSWGQNFDRVASTIALASTAAVASLAHVGAQYNVLMQKTTAAFTVLLGGAEQAQGMVKELTDFARESPFPRQLFIQGAQQLIGFGLAAKKVVPAFEAIEDAVAAVGGGQEEILQFTNIFARIKSLGKANSEELMRFSLVGIDAFKMLAESSGKSVNQIRQEVSEGLMGADETIDMLVKGLTDKFGGAAALVKKTWVGATDRIKGAWRDIGSKLMAPFIDPNGGGAAVKWANQIADLLRMLERTVIPLVVERVKEFAQAIQRITDDIDFEDWLKKGQDLWNEYGSVIQKLLPILGAVGLAFAKQGLGMVPFIGQMANFIPLPGKAALAMIGLVLSTDKGREAVKKLGDTLQSSISRLLPRIIPTVEQLVDAFAAILPPLVEIAAAVLDTGLPILVTVFQMVAASAKMFLAVLTPIANFLADHPALVQAVVAAYAAWKFAEIVGGISDLISALDIAALLLGRTATTTRIATAATVEYASATRIAAINQNLAMMSATGWRGALARVSTFLSGSLLPMLGRAKLFMAGLGGAATAGLVTGLIASNSILDNASKKAAEFKSANEDVFTFDHETKSLNEWRNEINALGAEYNRLKREGEDNKFGLRGFAQDLNPFADNTVRESKAAAAAIEDDLFRARSAVSSAITTINEFGRESGIGGAAAETLAKVMGIDVTQSSKDLKVALRAAWSEVRASGKEHKIFAETLGMTEAGYERFRAKSLEAAEVTARLRRELIASGDVQAAGFAKAGLSQDILAGFESAAAQISAIPEQLAPDIEQLNQAWQQALSPLQTWGSAMATVEQRVQEEHGVFIEDLRAQYDAWIAKHTESNLSFEEWAAKINGVDFEQFKGAFDVPAMALEEWKGQMMTNIKDFNTWRENLITIAEKGGAQFAMELAKLGPQAASFVAEVANTGGAEFEEVKSIWAAGAAATVDSVMYELGLMEALAGQGTSATVREIEDALGVLPGGITKIMEEASGDFDFVLQGMAILAANGGKMSADELAAALSVRLNENLPTVRASVNSYIGLFNALGASVTGAANSLVGAAGFGFRPASGVRAAADGGIFKFFAGGGMENHVAQIASGTTRIWAEPETGGEAYIPLAMSKRARSMNILGQVAAIFGAQLTVPGRSFATGGLHGSGASGSSSRRSSSHGDTIVIPISIGDREIERLIVDVDARTVRRGYAPGN